MDFLLISIYTASFTLRFLCMYKFWSARREIEQSTSLDPDKAFYTIYWLNADRFYWDTSDPTNISEGLLAIASILSFVRISKIFTVFKSLGILQISLQRMLMDIVRFTSLFFFVMWAFILGLHNLFQYYDHPENLEIENRNMTINAKQSFGTLKAGFTTVFGSLFGRGEPDVVLLNEYNNNVTEEFGFIIYWVYNTTFVIVLLNMLIAIMTRSCQKIAEDSDVEWMFARSVLFMEYIDSTDVLPAPFNIMFAPTMIFKSLYYLCCHSSDEDVATVEESVGTGTANLADGSFAIEMTETNESTSTERNFPTTSSINEEPELDEQITYTKVMRRIVQRYIFDIQSQREAEVTKDDFEEIQEDISIDFKEIKQDISNLANNLITMKKQIESLHSELSGRNGSCEGRKKEPTKASVVCRIAAPEAIEASVKDKKEN
ncbi:short transient receptor potential channel 7-like [Patella vulgata]|uniref:short transient receptor potential channel 7-like n=1 Tax=Patella vulgata TaxID=6465 RepID=UPI0024A9A91A|nr:short transient receptor potential channel 7-like [Patella vulgata]